VHRRLVECFGVRVLSEGLFQSFETAFSYVVQTQARSVAHDEIMHAGVIGVLSDSLKHRRIYKILKQGGGYRHDRADGDGRGGFSRNEIMHGFGKGCA